jgi:hypothetical protein
MTASVPYVLTWLAIAAAILAAPLLLVLPITPALDRWHDWRRLRASRAARPVTGEHYAESYMRYRALRRGVLAVAA